MTESSSKPNLGGLEGAVRLPTATGASKATPDKALQTRCETFIEKEKQKSTYNFTWKYDSFHVFLRYHLISKILFSHI